MKRNILKKILIIDCYTKEKHLQFMKNNMLIASSLYKNIISNYCNNIEFTVLNPCYNDFELPIDNNLKNINGVIFTGSSYSVYQDNKHVNNCKKLFHKILEHKIDTFGSCFGLQLFVQETGGIIGKSKKGREIGICRDIIVNNPNHYLFNNKIINQANIFNSICSHEDEIVNLNNGTILSYNNHSIQSCEINYKDTNLIGVQYHPEYTLQYLGQYLQIRKNQLFQNKIVTDEVLFDLFTNYLIEGKYDNKQYNNFFNLPNELIIEKRNHTEIINWVNNLH